MPRPPEVPRPHPFPLLATIAPVAASVGLWLWTSSPYALLFAVLGPVIAVASVGDSRLDARRVRKKERARFERDYERARQAIECLHRREATDLARLAPTARSLIDSPDHDPERWRGDLSRPVAVRLGTGHIRSAIDVEADVPGPASSATEARLADLGAQARSLLSAPVVTDARLGVGFVGPPTIARAAARALAVQVLASLPPNRVTITMPGEGDAWRCLDEVPHRVVRRDVPQASETITFSSGERSSPDVVLAIAATIEALPRAARIVVMVDGSAAEVVRHPDPGALGLIEVEFVTAEDTAGWVSRIARRAVIDGVGHNLTRVPIGTELTPLLGGPSGELRGLLCGIGLGEAGVVEVDLVSDGPHAVVGGTTGSGKSELLISWVLGIASARPPSAVSFLFVDFKGGASFDALSSLPHSVGVITDLDTTEALRALSSLRAEVRRRERLLSASRTRSLDDMPAADAFARLVIVVDEYAAVIDEYPDLHSLFIDLSARGRSLGIHLVLCTQRPAGVVRDSILANTGLRISLRVNSAADSSLIIGSDAAAALPPDVPGRALLSVSGSPPRIVQVARAAAVDIATVADRWSSAERAPRPWCEPLPEILPVPEFAGTVASRALDASMPFGLADIPAEQRRAVAYYDPFVHGNLAVVGGTGAGKTGFLAALGTAATHSTVTAVSNNLAAVWDVLTALLHNPVRGQVLLLDDIDALMAACPDDYSASLLDMLTRILREGPAVGMHTVMTMQRIPGSLHSLVALCGETLLLRLPSRQEHLLAGGDAQNWSADLPPGAGFWRTTRVQVVAAEAEVLRWGGAETRLLDVTEDPSARVIVSSRAAALAGELRGANPSRTVMELEAQTNDPRNVLVTRGSGPAPIIVGDPVQWQAHWGAIGALRSTRDVIFDGCSVADFRSLTGLRETLPPPPIPGERAGWRVSPDGQIQRVRLAVSGGEESRTGGNPLSPPPGEGPRGGGRHRSRGAH